MKLILLLLTCLMAYPILAQETPQSDNKTGQATEVDDPVSNEESKPKQPEVDKESNEPITAKHMEEVFNKVLDKREALPKFTISPEKQNYSFSFGKNFDFIDGLNNNTIYSDIQINIGSFLKDTISKKNSRFSVNFGATRGRNATRVSDSTKCVGCTNAEKVLVESESDTTASSGFKPRFIKYTSQTTPVSYSEEVLSVFGKVNFMFLDRSIKLYATSQLEYVFLQKKTETNSILTGIDTTYIPSDVRDVPRVVKPVLDEENQVITISSYFLPSIGITVFKESPQFDFLCSIVAGVPLSSSQPLNGAVIVTRASILEKQKLGAKLGFEMRYFKNQKGEVPSYYFYLSKQIDLQEFFELFSTK